jgi:outer membrane protein assembly factor BamE (lipoprotein component of BamABCDE complex)
MISVLAMFRLPFAAAPRLSLSIQRFAMAVGLAVALTACGFVYRIPIQQGNVTSKEEIEKVKIGMSKNEVRNTLGTALVQDAFHANRWDFVYWLAPRGGAAKYQHKVSLVFDGDRLSKIDGEAPAEKDLKIGTAK